MTKITFEFKNARDIHLAIDQLRALEATVPQDVTVTYTTTQAGQDQPEPRPERVSLSDDGLISHFQHSNYEFRTAGGLFDDIGHYYNDKSELEQHLNGLVSDGALRTARRSRDGARLYSLA